MMPVPPKGYVQPLEALCQGKCPHERCNMQKSLAAKRCVYCGSEIGFGQNYFLIAGEPAHCMCHGMAYAAGRSK